MDTSIISQSKEKHKRTPNCACVVCGKPLYRRPFELAKVRHVACMDHRAEAQRLSGITDAQQAGLSLGREKGTNHRKGYKHKEESKRKSSETHKRYWAENPDKALALGEKLRGEKHYRWKGGATRLNRSIRLMTENRRWMDAVKERDNACVYCGSTENLESHHKKPIAALLKEHDIKNRDDARKCPELWDLDNGETVCQRCHCEIHNRQYTPHGNVRRYQPNERKEKRSTNGEQNPNWKGGSIEKKCLFCGESFWVKRCRVDERKYCNRKCVNDSRRKNLQQDACSSTDAIQKIT